MQDRLIKFLEHLNISAARFSDEIGIQKSSLSHVLSGRNKPSYDFINKILGRYPELNANWLISGKGAMILNHPDFNYKSQSAKYPKTEQNNDLFSGVEMNVKSNTSREQPKQEENNKNPESITKPNVIDKFTDVNIEKIVVFYKNNTFSVYHPA
jgi:transcriptional regulator with XRE-family HTH domain